MLETWRTGNTRSSQIIQDAVLQYDQRQWNPRYMFWIGHNIVPAAETAAVQWADVYKQLLRIASHYGLTRQEFEYCCTAQASTGVTQRVFFPYHVLSRPQAEELLWDWSMVHGTARGMLTRMRSMCNKHAEAAGYGEKEVDAVRFIYWWCHHLCGQIQRIKVERPTAILEEIAFQILDRWGFPVVPWTSNRLKASLCKKQDHGIAMLFGYNRPDNEEFDPVKHFDMARCTVTIDTQATNMAMGRSSVSSWDGIREILSAVPLSHPLWQLDPALGITSWTWQWHAQMTPQAPATAVQIPLLPLDPWLNGGSARQPLRCVECPNAEFPTIGLLVRHYQRCHDRENSDPAADDDAPNPAQDEIDKQYWTITASAHSRVAGSPSEGLTTSKRISGRYIRKSSVISATGRGAGSRLREREMSATINRQYT